MAINGINQPGPQNLQAMRDDINRLIDKMREVAGKQSTPDSPAVNEPAEFSALLSQAKSSINEVNNLTQTSSEVRDKYLMGDKNVKLTDVVLASQKSSLAFQALITVRNKMIDAYRDVMNMPV